MQEMHPARDIVPLDVLARLETLCPSCLWRAHDQAEQEVVLLRLSPDLQLPAQEALVVLRQVSDLQMRGAALLYAIDLHHLDLLTPASSSALLLWAEELKREAPVLFTHVLPEVLQGLGDLHASLHLSSAFWVMDEAGKPQIVGALPDRLQTIVDVLQVQGEICAADLAAARSDPSKKTTNRFSVYLQELSLTGLVVREKVPASFERSRKRGWTYRYQPVYRLMNNGCA